jgi:hypothetical protein
MNRLIIVFLFFVFPLVANSKDMAFFTDAYKNTFKFDKLLQFMIIRTLAISDSNISKVTVADTSFFVIKNDFSYFRSKDQEILRDSQNVIFVDYQTKNIIVQKNLQISDPYYFLVDIFPIRELSFSSEDKANYLFRQDMTPKANIPQKHLFADVLINKTENPKIEKVIFNYKELESIMDTATLSLEKFNDDENKITIDNMYNYIFKSLNVLNEKYSNFKLRDLR